ncbi:MAG TPA: transcriptional repressor [Bacteroidales bacterium]|nr:transcriptional repressor [Bacteroidales bacterium]
MEIKEIRNKLVEKGLKVTPQRIAILEAIATLNNHPTAEQIIDYVRQHHPNLATGTAYKILEVMAGHELIRKVKTDRDIMRYDAMMENHHHLYCIQSDRIEDYMDAELNNMLESYFNKKNIPGFTIEDIKLQIIGRFSERL